MKFRQWSLRRLVRLHEAVAVIWEDPQVEKVARAQATATQQEIPFRKVITSWPRAGLTSTVPGWTHDPGRWRRYRRRRRGGLLAIVERTLVTPP